MRGFKSNRPFIIFLSILFIGVGTASADETTPKKNKKKKGPPRQEIVIPDPAAVAAHLTENPDFPTEMHHDEIPRAMDNVEEIVRKAQEANGVTAKSADLPGKISNPSETKQRICRQLRASPKANQIKVQKSTFLWPFGRKVNAGAGWGHGVKAGIVYKNVPDAPSTRDDTSDCLSEGDVPTNSSGIELADPSKMKQLETIPATNASSTVDPSSK